MQQEQAETIALQALGWIAAEDGLLEIFLDASGSARDELPERVGDPAFLGAVLDFLLQADQHVIGFCDTAGLGYEAPMRARRALPGGAVPDWT